MREIMRLIFNKRFRRIIGLVLIFALQFWWLGKSRRFLSRDRSERRYHQLYRWQAEYFTATALDMGGLLIKLGQFFSSRVDILPSEYTDKLTELQDSVPPVNSESIVRRLTEELGPPEQLFTSFSWEPLAAASLGQVHRATLNDGEEVAVKVLRPGIEEIIGLDLKALRVVMTFARRFPRISRAVDLDKVYQEFSQTVTDELNYEKEGRNAEIFRRNFAGESLIYVPRIIWPLSTRRILTMEYVKGIKINEYDELDKLGIDRSRLAKLLVSVYLQQILIDGFFHADPHPGNLLVQEHGRLVFIDFGMVGRVSRGMKAGMTDLVLGAVKKDTGAIVAAFEKLGFLRPDADKSIIRKSVSLMLADLYGDTIDLSRLDFGELALEFRELIYSQPFQIPANTTFLGKTAVTVLGLCIGLDDQFDAMGSMAPYIRKVFLEGNNKGAWSEVWDRVKRMAADLAAAPDRINRFVDGVESGEIRFYPSRSFENKLLTQQSFLNGRMVAAIMASGFLVSGSELIKSIPRLGICLMILAALSALTLLRRNPAGRINGEQIKRMVAGEEIAPGFRQPRFHPAAGTDQEQRAMGE